MLGIIFGIFLMVNYASPGMGLAMLWTGGGVWRDRRHGDDRPGLPPAVCLGSSDFYACKPAGGKGLIARSSRSISLAFNLLSFAGIAFSGIILAAGDLISVYNRLVNIGR